MLADPIADMSAARARARQLGDPYVDVCFLATVTDAGQPTSHAIALRDIDAPGIALLINANSPTWQHLMANGQYALLVFWAMIQRQYRIQGRLEPMEAARLRQYWARKGYDSRLLEAYYETARHQSETASITRGIIGWHASPEGSVSEPRGHTATGLAPWDIPLSHDHRRLARVTG